MSATPIPAGALFLCLMGAGLIGGTVWYSMQPPAEHEFVQMPSIIAGRDDATTEPHRYHDNVLAIEASEAVIKQSGFAPDRSPFSRSIQRATPTAQKPEYDPQYVGSMGSGTGLKVMVRWRPGEQPAVHSVGDKTPWGTLIELSASELIFETNGERKALALF